jgi:hypothetical protein
MTTRLFKRFQADSWNSCSRLKGQPLRASETHLVTQKHALLGKSLSKLSLQNLRLAGKLLSLSQ